MERTMKYWLLLALVLIPITTNAVCSTVAVDGNGRLKNLAQYEFQQAVEEFKKENNARACEHLKLSRSYIKQTDQAIAKDYIVVLYDKMCGEK